MTLQCKCISILSQNDLIVSMYHRTYSDFLQLEIGISTVSLVYLQDIGILRNWLRCSKIEGADQQGVVNSRS